MDSKSSTGVPNELSMGKNEFYEAPQKKSNKVTLSPSHPLMVKYQQDLKERLLKLLQEADEQLIDLKRSIEVKENENKYLSERGCQLQKELTKEDEKLKSLQKEYSTELESKKHAQEECKNFREKYQIIEDIWQSEIDTDLSFQKRLEDVAFEVVQLTSLKSEAFIGTKSLQHALEKITKDRENIELQKLRQDLLLARLENDKSKVEDKINLYKVQWGIKKEETAELRKELNAALSEMEVILVEKQQIVQQWKQSLASLGRQDQTLAQIKETERALIDQSHTLQLDITSCKRSVRAELERNETLTHRVQFRERDIARIESQLNEIGERLTDLEGEIDVLQRTVEIEERELGLLEENITAKEKELEAVERQLQKAYTHRQGLEKKHMDILHEKMTATKASKNAEKLIKDVRNTIRLNEQLGAKKENDREKLLLKLDNLRIHVDTQDSQLDSMLSERAKKEELLADSEERVIETKMKIDAKRAEGKKLNDKLRELVERAGGEELGPLERELSHLRKETSVTERSQRSMEKEYLRFQQELFSISKQAAVRMQEADFCRKKVAVMEGRRMQLEADVVKEEKDIKEVHNRIQVIRREIAHVSNVLTERNELQENLIQANKLTKSDFIKLLKEAELSYLERQHELKLLRRKKKKHFDELIEMQRHIVYWEGKIHVAEDTRKIVKSESRAEEAAVIRREIRRLQLKTENIRKEQLNLMRELEVAVIKYTNLYIEADKQILYGNRRKSPEFVEKKLEYLQKKVISDKKELHNCIGNIKTAREKHVELDRDYENEKAMSKQLTEQIKSLEESIDYMEQEKRQTILELSFKQKRAKLLQKVSDGSYIRAVRNETRRTEEIAKLSKGLRTVSVIVQATMNEYPDLNKSLCRVLDYVEVSKQL